MQWNDRRGTPRHTRRDEARSGQTMDRIGWDKRLRDLTETTMSPP